jgi:hypothetical protein
MYSPQIIARSSSCGSDMSPSIWPVERVFYPGDRVISRGDFHRCAQALGNLLLGILL